MAPVEKWLSVRDVTARAQCGRKAVYRAVAAGLLRGSRIDGRGRLRFAPEWVNDWMETTSSPSVGQLAEALAALDTAA